MSVAPPVTIAVLRRAQAFRAKIYDMADQRLDVAVVGAGVIGLAIARELHGRGVRVAVFERTGIGAGASGVQPGGVRQQWGTPVACRLARESAGFYANADALLESTVPLGFSRVRVPVRCAYGSDSRAPGRQRRGAERRRRPLTPRHADEAAELVPGLREDTITGGAWCAEDGYFDRPQAVVEAFGRGLDIRIGAIDSLDRSSQTWWSSRRVPRRPICCSRSESTYRSNARTASSSSASRSASGYSTPSSFPLSAALPPSNWATEGCLQAILAHEATRRNGRPGGPTCVRESKSSSLPLAYVPFPVLVRGEYDVTPDHQPILGRVGDGLYVAAGFSGHGFMIAPAVARIVADAVTGAAHDETLASSTPHVSRRTVPFPSRNWSSALMFLQLVANGLVTGSVIAIAAAGVSLVYGSCGSSTSRTATSWPSEHLPRMRSMARLDLG